MLPRRPTDKRYVFLLYTLSLLPKSASKMTLERGVEVREERTHRSFVEVSRKRSRRKLKIDIHMVVSFRPLLSPYRPSLLAWKRARGLEIEEGQGTRGAGGGAEGRLGQLGVRFQLCSGARRSLRASGSDDESEVSSSRSRPESGRLGAESSRSSIGAADRSGLLSRPQHTMHHQGANF